MALRPYEGIEPSRTEVNVAGEATGWQDVPGSAMLFRNVDPTVPARDDAGMRRQLANSAVAALAVAAFALASCGGGGTPAITKAEYVKEGNLICQKGNDSIAAQAKQPGPGDDPGVAATFVRVFVPGIRDQIRQLRALGYPKGDKERLEGTYRKAESYLDRAEQDPSTIDGHAFDDVNAELNAYGLTVCGS